MKSERELESVGTTTIPRLDNNASGTVPIIFLTKDDLTAATGPIGPASTAFLYLIFTENCLDNGVHYTVGYQCKKEGWY